MSEEAHVRLVDEKRNITAQPRAFC